MTQALGPGGGLPPRLPQAGRPDEAIRATVEAAVAQGGGLGAMDYKIWKAMQEALELERANLNRAEIKQIALRIQAALGDMVEEKSKEELMAMMGIAKPEELQGEVERQRRPSEVQGLGQDRLVLSLEAQQAHQAKGA